MEPRLAKLRVVIHCDAVPERYGLAGQHVARSDLLVREAVAGGHFDFALGHLGPTGRAHAGLTSEWRRQAGSARAVEDVALGEGHPARAAVKRHGDADAL